MLFRSSRPVCSAPSGSRPERTTPAPALGPSLPPGPSWPFGHHMPPPYGDRGQAGGRSAPRGLRDAALAPDDMKNFIASNCLHWSLNPGWTAGRGWFTSRWGLGLCGQGALLSLHPRLSVGGRVSRWGSQHCPRTLVTSTLPPKTHRKYVNTPHLLLPAHHLKGH